MAGSATSGDGGPAWGTDRDGTSRTRPPPRLVGPPLPCGISGDGRPPRSVAPTSTSKKRRSTFVAPTRPAAHRPGGGLPLLDLGAGGVRPRQIPEPAHLPSHQVQKRSMMEATTTVTASDTPRTASMTSLHDDGDYFISSSMPFYEWSPTQDPVGSSSQSYVAMLTQENSEADLEALTQAPLADSGSNRGRGGNYNHNEDIQLCWSWMAITFDPRIGNDQPKGTYWNRIAQHHHDNKTFDSIRNANSLEKRWNTVHRECVRFQECFEKIERLRPSGVPRTEYINLAQKSFDETKGFPYIHCWMEVRHTEKFQSICEKQVILRMFPVISENALYVKSENSLYVKSENVFCYSECNGSECL
ncbi:unnamed protein product [Urochloa decumbens]|uniref:Myb-like domain-containing protein n=1 Tax=Urochloa decumbens TaxID=240449 RepID=A0ABC9DHC5_9POAL